jgi:pantothenate kinase
MSVIEMKEKMRKKISYRKNVNNQWEASLCMADGYCYSVAVAGSANTAKAQAADALLNTVMKQGDHPLPLQ